MLNRCIDCICCGRCLEPKTTQATGFWFAGCSLWCGCWYGQSLVNLTAMKQYRELYSKRITLYRLVTVCATCTCYGKINLSAATDGTTAQVCAPIAARTQVRVAQLCPQLHGVSAAGQPQSPSAALHPSRGRHQITGACPWPYPLGIPPASGTGAHTLSV